MSILAVEPASRALLPLLIIAILNKNYRQTRDLLAAGADPNLKTDHGLAPLHFATKLPRFIKLLLYYHANINVRTRAGDTPLHIAAHYGFAHGVRVLIARGANIALVNTVGQTPLDVSSAPSCLLRRLHIKTARYYLVRAASILPLHPSVIYVMAECAICLDELRDSRILPCGHMFCARCIGWCCATAPGNTFHCPLDRASYEKSIVPKLKSYP